MTEENSNEPLFPLKKRRNHACQINEKWNQKIYPTSFRDWKLRQICTEENQAECKHPPFRFTTKYRKKTKPRQKENDEKKNVECKTFCSMSRMCTWSSACCCCVQGEVDQSQTAQKYCNIICKCGMKRIVFNYFYLNSSVSRRNSCSNCERTWTVSATTDGHREATCCWDVRRRRTRKQRKTWAWTLGQVEASRRLSDSFSKIC